MFLCQPLLLLAALFPCIIMFLCQPLLLLAALFPCKLLAETEHTDVQAMQEKHMMQAAYCKDQVLPEEERYRQLSVRSKIECAVQCRLDDQCVSVVFDRRQQACHLAQSRAFENCSNMDSLAQGQEKTIFFYQEVPPCGAGEVLDSMGQCVCAPGFHGTPCTRYFHDCSDLHNYGDWKGAGIYSVQPLSSSQPFKVMCRHITHTRTYVMQRKKKKKRESFDRSWADYKKGFGDLDSDFWLGLEKLHILTSADRLYKMRVSIKLINSSIVSYSYDEFQVANEASNFRLDFNASRLNVTDDCFFPLLNASFSTFDHDMDDNNDLNCAKTRKGGFWFRGANCSLCNPHGVIYGKDDGLLTGATDEVFWSSLGKVAPFKLSMYLVSD